MARVEERGGVLVRAAQWYAKRRYGRELTITPVIAHSRPNMLGWGAFEFLHEQGHAMDERLKTLAATKVATKVGCQFCIDIGTALGRTAGITERQLREFHDYRTSDAFSDEEKLVMEYADQLTTEPVDVSEELFGRLREHFGESEIVELTAAIAIENFRARFNNALDIAPAGFSEGMYCPLPAATEAQSEVRTNA